MSKKKKLKRLFVAFLLIYPVFVISVFYKTNEEIYPFATWNMFSKVPNSPIYSIRVLTTSSKVNKSHISQTSRKTNAFGRATQFLGHAIDAKENLENNLYKNRVDTFLREMHVRSYAIDREIFQIEDQSISPWQKDAEIAKFEVDDAG